MPVAQDELGRLPSMRDDELADRRQTPTRLAAGANGPGARRNSVVRIDRRPRSGHARFATVHGTNASAPVKATAAIATAAA